MGSQSEPDADIEVATDFARRFRAQIIAGWLDRARSTAAGRTLSETRLSDHMPYVLDEIVANMAIGADGDTPNAVRHAVERFTEGFDVATVVHELAMLRSTVFDLWEKAAPGSIRALAMLDAAIDDTIEHTAARYVEAEHARRESVLAMLESLLAASPVGIAFVDRDLRYVRINDALADMNGRPAAEHIGRTVRQVLPEIADEYEPLLRRILETGVPVLDLVIEVPGDDAKESRTLLANYFPVRGATRILGLGAVVADVTTTKRTERALLMERARLQSIIEHAPAAIWVKDAAGRIVLANHRLAEAAGKRVEEVVGKGSEEIFPEEIAKQHQEHDRIVLAEDRAIHVEEVAPADGQLRTFLTIKFPIPGDRPLVGGIATEITDRKRMEEELRAAVRARDDMMAVVSHDLRSPLSTIQLSTTTLAGQNALDPRARRHVEMIHRACRRMESLIEDLLDASTIRAGRFQVELTRQPIGEVVAEALDLQAPLAAEKGIALDRRCELSGLHAMCDRDRIIQVFANLIGNAVKFCRAGDTITVRCDRVENQLRISIADTGPGIPSERLPRLFDPYWSGQEHGSLGAGLGLFIVSGIVESHGGRIWVESELGSGATFSFTIPLID